MLIYNATLVTWETENRVIPNYAVRIDGKTIREIGSSAELLAKYPSEEKIDAEEKIVMPGQICAHTHFYGAFSRGMAIPGRPAKDFPEILNNLWYKLDRALDPESVRFSAELLTVNAEIGRAHV